MRVFVYEYLTAVGLGRDPADPLHGMYREGRAMRDAIAEDFGRLPGVEVVTADGTMRRRERERFREHLTGCEWCLLIAPPNDLVRKAGWAFKAGVRVLNPDGPAIRLTSCKVSLADHWRAAGVQTPAGGPWLTWVRDPPRFPAVCKPAFGAGSTATFRADRMDDLPPILAMAEADGVVETGMLIQDYVPGRAASVAFLCGPAGNVPLVPCWQHLSDDGRFKYLGGELPIPPDLARRAIPLATRAVGCVPGLRGYVGVDLVLGDAPDGSQDYAIEINPRLTTSYVGLRALAGFNLAAAMLAVAEGQEPPLAWSPGRVRFGADGTATAGG